MSKSFVIFCTLILSLTVMLLTVDAIGHCSNHTFANSQGTSYMQFTKETVHQDYAVESQFKALHCCAKGYRSIEWWVAWTSKLLWQQSPSNVSHHLLATPLFTLRYELIQTKLCQIYAHDLELLQRRFHRNFCRVRKNETETLFCDSISKNFF